MQKKCGEGERCRMVVQQAGGRRLGGREEMRRREVGLGKDCFK